MSLNRMLPGVVVAVLLTVAHAEAYEAVPHAAAKVLDFEPVHESLTLASLACANQALDGQRLDCMSLSKRLKELGAAYLKHRGKQQPGPYSLDGHTYDPAEVQELIDGVLWPDDPTRMHSALAREGRAALNHFHVCTKLQDKYLSCANRYCMSHFGNLQFVHAMVPAAPWCEKARRDSPTCELAGKPVRDGMEQWVKWLVPLARGETRPTDLLFAQQGAFPHQAFDQKHCNRESGMWWWKVLPMYPDSMMVEELLYTSCDGVGAGKCDVIVPSDHKERKTQRLALGALLHMVQDSYAQGHTVRRPTDKRPAGSAFVACAPVEQFHDYGKQVQDEKAREAHKAGDKYPQWDSSCGAADRQVDDPITAGANLIVMLKKPGTTGEQVWDYLSQRVFGLARP